MKTNELKVGDKLFRDVIIYGEIRPLVRTYTICYIQDNSIFVDNLMGWVINKNTLIGECFEENFTLQFYKTKDEVTELLYKEQL